MILVDVWNTFRVVAHWLLLQHSFCFFALLCLLSIVYILYRCCKTHSLIHHTSWRLSWWAGTFPPHRHWHTNSWLCRCVCRALRRWCRQPPGVHLCKEDSFILLIRKDRSVDGQTMRNLKVLQLLGGQVCHQPPFEDKVGCPEKVVLLMKVYL